MREGERQTQRETDTERDRQTERERETDRHETQIIPITSTEKSVQEVQPSNVFLKKHN